MPSVTNWSVTNGSETDWSVTNARETDWSVTNARETCLEELDGQGATADGLRIHVWEREDMVLAPLQRPSLPTLRRLRVALLTEVRLRQNREGIVR